MISLQSKDGLEFFTSDKAGALHGFTTRGGGVSTGAFASLNLGVRTEDDPQNVAENYRRVKNVFGIEKFVLAKQEHTDVVLAVGKGDAGTGEIGNPSFAFGVDGLLSDVPGIALGVFTADCSPVLLYDGKRGVVGAVHSGWRGTALKITRKAVLLMKEKYGSAAEDITAVIGPSIKRCCFEIKSDAEEILREAYPNLDFIKHTEDGIFADTAACIEYDLQDLGVKNIDVCEICTCCSNNLLFSHRMGDKGRQLGIIVNRKIRN